WRTGRSRALTIALVVLWVAFIVGNVRGSEVFGSVARPEFWPTVYMAVFLGYMAYVLVDVMIGCWHYASSAGGALGVGLRLMAAGCASALTYAAFKVAALALVDLGPRMPAFLESTIGRTDVVLAGVLVAVGASLPAMVRRWQVASRWSRSYVAHDQLYPLWSALIAVMPGLALDPPGSRIRDRLRVRDLDMRLYRRVIEIRDGRLELRELFAPSVVAASRALALDRGLHGRAAGAFVEAKVLEAALLAVTTGQAIDEPWVGAIPEGESTADEVEWLREVARQFSPPGRLWHNGASIRSGAGRVA
ncbi:MAG: MAB_1171c family putative transporter, partial [Dermatophilaceae bacterium]